MNEKKTGCLPATASLGDACCGCGACAAVCPKGCIAMQEDACGLLHPHVDVDVCVGCGMCDRACPALDSRAHDAVRSVEWVRAKNDDLLDHSSSGGVFGLLARNCLERGGTVFGAAFANDFHRVRHVRVDCDDDLDAVMRSKYLQSSIDREVYEGVASDLRAGLPVLFSGTACQIAGMRGYLEAKRVKRDNLLLVDVICHGIPAPGLWGAWVDWNEDEQQARLSNMNFRSKTTGWSSYSLLYEYSRERDGASHAVSLPNGDDWYMRAFLSNASLRPSCFFCPAKCSCGSDLTLGDFWGIQNQHPEAMSEQGVSAIIASTEKGESALARILPLTEHGQSTFDSVLAGNPALVSSPKPYRKAGKFMTEVALGTPISEMMRRWDFRSSVQARLISNAKHIVKRLIGRS